MELQIRSENKEIIPESCGMKIHIKMPINCNMNPPCPYCGVFHSLFFDDSVLDVKSWFKSLKTIQKHKGPLHISCLYGEPFSDRNLMRVLGMLSSDNFIDCFSNMISVKNIVKDSFLNVKNLCITASFHPHYWGDINRFIDRIFSVKDMGVKCDRVFLVAYPPNFKNIDQWSLEFSNHNLDVFVMPFSGWYDNKEYPLSYTEEDWITVNKYLVSKFGRSDFMRSRKGILCLAGKDIVFADCKGNVYSCPCDNPYFFGNLLDGSFEVFKKPMPCMSSICQCPDLWALNVESLD